MARLRRADDGSNRRKLQATNSLQVVDNLLLLVSQLCFVIDMLSGAPTARPEMLTERLGARRRKTAYRFDTALQEGRLNLRQLYVDRISRCATLYKQHLSIEAGEALAFRSHRIDQHIFENIALLHRGEITDNREPIFLQFGVFRDKPCFVILPPAAD